VPKRYRERKAGKEVAPSLRASRAQLVRAAAGLAGVSIRTINRHLAKERTKIVDEAIAEGGDTLARIKEKALAIPNGFLY
jgi:predicted DNA-binding transcriptional regulator YafY